MKLAGFGLDNLSLMALTIATGFVVDDAIVMIENVVRLVERGMKPLDAAFEGAKQIGFSQVKLDDATRYAAEDADITLRLHRKLWPQLDLHRRPGRAVAYDRPQRLARNLHHVQIEPSHGGSGGGLQAVGDAIRIRLVKDHDNKDLAELTLDLDPRTYLIKQA